MYGITPKMLEVLEYIDEYQRDNKGISPSFGEIAAKGSHKTHTGVHRTMRELAQRGYIRMIPGHGRSVRIIRWPMYHPKADETMRQVQMDDLLHRMDKLEAEWWGTAAGAQK